MHAYSQLQGEVSPTYESTSLKPALKRRPHFSSVHVKAKAKLET